MNQLLLISSVLTSVVFISQSAAAYLDPGSGSFLLQLIVGALLSGLFAIKLYFRKIKKYIFRNKKSDESNSTEKTE
jgi:hydrogenase-4 membrane subunit HyfE